MSDDLITSTLNKDIYVVYSQQEQKSYTAQYSPEISQSDLEYSHRDMQYNQRTNADNIESNDLMNDLTLIQQLLHVLYVKCGHT